MVVCRRLRTVWSGIDRHTAESVGSIISVKLGATIHLLDIFRFRGTVGLMGKAELSAVVKPLVSLSSSN